MHVPGHGVVAAGEPPWGRCLADEQAVGDGTVAGPGEETGHGPGVVRGRGEAMDIDVWFNEYVMVISHPAIYDHDDKLHDVDIVINVSDYFDMKFNMMLLSRCIQSFWFPVGEAFGFPLENIYAAMLIMWHAEKKQKKLLLHCMSGKNRSIAVADCYYYLRVGRHRPDNSKNIIYGRSKPNQLLENIRDNQLPGVYRMEVFLDKCREVFERPEVAEMAYVDWVKRNSLYF